MGIFQLQVRGNISFTGLETSRSSRLREVSGPGSHDFSIDWRNSDVGFYHIARRRLFRNGSLKQADDRSLHSGEMA